MGTNTSNSFGSIWTIVRGKHKNKKRFNQSDLANILLNGRYLTLRVEQFAPYTSTLTIEYEGECVSTSLYRSNKFKNVDELKSFASDILSTPEAKARIIEIERGASHV